MIDAFRWYSGERRAFPSEISPIIIKLRIINKNQWRIPPDNKINF